MTNRFVRSFPCTFAFCRLFIHSFVRSTLLANAFMYCIYIFVGFFILFIINYPNGLFDLF